MSDDRLKEFEEKREEAIKRINRLSSRLSTRLEKREEIYRLKREVRKLWKQIVHLKKVAMKEA